MAVEEGLDTGGVYDRAEVPIGPDDTLEELRSRLVAEGHSHAGRHALDDGLGEPAPQVGEPTYADKLDGRGSPPRLDAARPSTSTAWCASATPGPRTTAGG